MGLRRPFTLDFPASRMARSGALWTLLALEILLTLSLRSMGWQSTWIVCAWCAVAVAGLYGLYRAALWGRRWALNRFRFRIATLLLSFVVISIGLAAFSTYSIRPYLERSASRRLERLGAEVYGPQRQTQSGDTPLVPDREVTSVDLSNDRMIASAADSLELLVGLNDLNLSGITDHGLQTLSQLNLQGDISVNLVQTQVTDEGLKALQECEWLSTLWLNGGLISDRGVLNISEFQQVTDLGLLQYGPGDHKRITDRALRGVGNMTQLEALTICGFHMTDDGLRSLSGLTNLRFLNLWNTGFTQQGIDELRESLPECRIVVDP